MQTDIAILDFSKAFDTVPHPKLIEKLESYGIRGSLYQWCMAFLTQRSMKVVVDGKSSDQVRVESGDPQGTVLGPLLSLSHINYLPAYVSSQVRLCGQLPTLLGNQDPGRPHCPARRLEKNWKPGLKNRA